MLALGILGIVVERNIMTERNLISLPLLDHPKVMILLENHGPKGPYCRLCFEALTSAWSWQIHSSVHTLSPL